MLFYILSLPERLLRALSAVLGGLFFEIAEVIFPAWLRRTRLYQALVYRFLRLIVELVGGVQAERTAEQIQVADLARRKAVGNVIELLSILAVGWSPLWILAAASDLSGGTRAYLETLVVELHRQGVLKDPAGVQSVDDLLGALETSTGVAADLVDIPPLEIQSLRQSWQALQQQASSLPGPELMAQTYRSLVETAREQRRSIGEVSALIAVGALKAGVNLTTQHTFSYYQQAFNAIQTEGWGAYARRVSKPYLIASAGHFDRKRKTNTEKFLTYSKSSERSMANEISTNANRSEPDTVFLFSRFGLGHAPEALQSSLAVKFLVLTLGSGQLPAKIVFYTEGVRLACKGSSVLEALRMLEAEGVELVLCKTCLDYFGIADQVEVGIVGGMPDIIETLQKAPKVISL